jgi:hypothetical protein
MATQRCGVYLEPAPRLFNRLVETTGAKQSGGNVGLNYQGIKLVGQADFTDCIVVSFQ